ncbi:hypothetical protein B0H14DRAFT_2663630 [Mycena olivaceomarginata]|nr:hypothetical protein B0H14DRAFT_2663630 [Mycena olivaceomarginata]
MTIEAPLLVGYYRCTDILFHYHESLKNSRETIQLQKILSRDAILHPRHPLAADGAKGFKGIQAYIGTFHDGQARLLFSSAQVDYLRYWMHAMKLTDNLIPLPYSDCMFLLNSTMCSIESNLATVVPVVLETLGALSYTSKKLGRMNQSLKEKPLLVPRRATFERVRTLWNAKKGVWSTTLAISDFGWSLVRWEFESGVDVTERGHLVVEANQKYKTTELENGGDYELVSKATLKQKISDLFSRLSQHAPIFLVSNDSKGDLKYLGSKDLQIPLPNAVFQLPQAVPAEGLFVVEPAELFDALTGSGDVDIDHDLERICKHLNISSGPVCNAATDAKRILQALHSMASGPQLDTQREERWPDLAKAEVGVEFPNFEEDLEGCFPPQKF